MPILRKKTGAPDYGLALAKRARAAAEARVDANAAADSDEAADSAVEPGRVALAEVQPTASTRSVPTRDRWLSPVSGVPGEVSPTETGAEETLRCSPRQAAKVLAPVADALNHSEDASIGAAVRKGLTSENFDLAENLRRGDQRQVDPALALIDRIMAEQDCDFDDARLILSLIHI